MQGLGAPQTNPLDKNLCVTLQSALCFHDSVSVNSTNHGLCSIIVFTYMYVYMYIHMYVCVYMYIYKILYIKFCMDFQLLRTVPVTPTLFKSQL